MKHNEESEFFFLFIKFVENAVGELAFLRDFLMLSSL